MSRPEPLRPRNRPRRRIRSSSQSAVAARAAFTALTDLTGLAATAVTVAVAEAALAPPSRPRPLELVGTAHLAGAAQPDRGRTPGPEASPAGPGRREGGSTSEGVAATGVGILPVVRALRALRVVRPTVLRRPESPRAPSSWSWCPHPEVPNARSTDRPSSCASSRCASLPSVNSTSRSASRIPCRASSASLRASTSGCRWP